jgi:hypothetical protein
VTASTRSSGDDLGEMRARVQLDPEPERPPGKRDSARDDSLDRGMNTSATDCLIATHTPLKLFAYR